MKKVYFIMVEIYEEGSFDEDYNIFGSRFYLSKEKAEQKCKKYNDKWSEFVKDGNTKQRRHYNVEYRFLDEEES